VVGWDVAEVPARVFGYSSVLLPVLSMDMAFLEKERSVDDPEKCEVQQKAILAIVLLKRGFLIS
jgi:hypothetical protein